MTENFKFEIVLTNLCLLKNLKPAGTHEKSYTRQTNFDEVNKF
jgi:hypothetical protein